MTVWPREELLTGERLLYKHIEGVHVMPYGLENFITYGRVRITNMIQLCS